MPDHVLLGVLTLTTAVCTCTMAVITMVVVVPRKQRHRPIRRPMTIALSIGAVGIAAAIWNLVLAFSS